jgi:hypothetical protein
MHPLAERALSYPGAILIRRDPNAFRAESDVAYVIGLQQPTKHPRYADVFVHGDQIWMYVRNVATRVAELLRSAGRLMPSETAPKYWSKVRVTDGPDDPSLLELLADSHSFVTESCSKKGRAALARLQGARNAFPMFHQAALELEHASDGRVYTFYSDVPNTPELSVDGKPAARFTWNTLEVSPSEGEWIAGPDQAEAWGSCLEELVERRLRHGQ